MPRYKDLTGIKIGRLKVIEPVGSKMISGQMIPKIHISEEEKQ